MCTCKVKLHEGRGEGKRGSCSVGVIASDPAFIFQM